MTVKTQLEIVADLIRRADILEASSHDKKTHNRTERAALYIAACALRSAANQNHPDFNLDMD